MSSEVLAFVVEPGWESCDIVKQVAGPSFRLLYYPDGSVRFEHRCDRGERGVIICAPALQIGRGHTVTKPPGGAPTVRASVLCPDCNTHGFITDGRWHAA